jgi:nitrate reductase beta subunit
MHSCVGRIRYLGVVLYDADRIQATASVAEKDLVDHQLDILMDPFDPEVVAAAKANGIADSTIRAAQQSPIYKFVKQWGLALPLHAEFRTLPMLFYVPPLLPVMATVKEARSREQAAKLNPVAKVWEDTWLYDTSTEELWGAIDQVRFPIKYLASLFSAGDEAKVRDPLKKLMAIRLYRRFRTVGDIPEQKALDALKDVGYTPEVADAVYHLTSLAKFDERYVVPPAHREHAIEMLEFTGDKRGSMGFGFKEGTSERGL